MALSIPPELKKISPFIRRAEELDRDTARPESRLVAYYLRQYAVQEGIPLSTLSESKVCLGRILEALEGEQDAMNQFTRGEAALICRQFCQKVFEAANEQDQMGLANQETAKAFYAASTFMQALAQFESNEDQKAEDRKRIIYSKWKATEILKALKDGRKSKPDDYENDEILSETDVTDKTDQCLKKLDAPYDPQPVKETDPTNDDMKKSDTGGSSQEIPLKSDTNRDQGSQEEEDLTTVVDTSLPSTHVYPAALPSSDVDLDARLPTDVTLGSPRFEPLSFTSSPILAEDSGVFRVESKATRSSHALTGVQVNDAIELTSFALAALQDKNYDLAAERLLQALVALGR